MKAAVLTTPAAIASRPLRVTDVGRPEVTDGLILLRVRACGICRTDLHILEGELPPRREALIPEHQIVGEIVEGATALLPGGTRVGVSWIGGVDGSCWYCRHGAVNLCDAPTFTGYSIDGGYAEYAVARSDFVFPLPPALDDLHAAPLLCTGIIGFRSLRVAGVQAKERWGSSDSAPRRIWRCPSAGLGLFGVRLDSWRRAPRVASSLGATWVGTERETPPVLLDRAITFAPSGDVVLAALVRLRKGGVVAVNAIHLDRMPEFDYDTLLWGESQIRSVTNMTRSDAHDLLQLAAEIDLAPQVTLFPLAEANEALLGLKNDAIRGAAVIVP